MDIETLRCVLAFHASAYTSATRLNGFLFRARELPGWPSPKRSALRHLVSDCDASHWQAADRALLWGAEPSHHLVALDDPRYPSALQNLAQPPLVLFVNGRLEVLSSPQIAIVGSRRATEEGRQTAYRLAGALASCGLVITSGLAAGIDAAAHRGSLDAGGRTTAIFGCGIDRVYPRYHRRLADQAAENGAVISEFPLGIPPKPYHFPRRNRIISGITLGTIVVEAAVRSGSISTAMHAAEQGREVFAVPGSVRNPLAAGCHELIKQGAALVTDVEDIIDQLPLTFRLSAKNLTVRKSDKPNDEDSRLSENEQKVLELCEKQQLGFDEIVFRSGLTPTDVSSILSALEVRGRVKSVAGNAYLKVIG